MFNLDGFARYLVVKRQFAENTLTRTLLQAGRIISFIKENNLPFEQSSIDAFLYTLHGKYKPSSINAFISTIRVMERYLKYSGSPIDLSIDLKRNKVDRPSLDVLTKVEVAAILNHDLTFTYAQNRIKDQLNDLYKTLVLFLIMTGCRYSEMASLQCQNISSEYVTFTETKSKVTRKVPLIEPLKGRLQPFLTGKHPKDLVFQTTAGTEINCQFFNRVLKRYGEDLSIYNYQERLHAHMFRHTFAVWQLRAKVPETIIARLLGHENLNTTNWYLSLVDSDLEEAMYMHPFSAGNYSKTHKLKKAFEYAVYLGLTIEELMEFYKNTPTV